MDSNLEREEPRRIHPHSVSVGGDRDGLAIRGRTLEVIPHVDIVERKIVFAHSQCPGQVIATSGTKTCAVRDGDPVVREGARVSGESIDL